MYKHKGAVLCFQFIDVVVIFYNELLILIDTLVFYKEKRNVKRPHSAASRDAMFCSNDSCKRI